MKRLDDRIEELAQEMGLQRDDPAVWRALVLEEGTWLTRENAPGRDIEDREDTPGRDSPKSHTPSTQKGGMK